MEVSKRELNKLFHKKVYYDYRHSDLTQHEISEKYKISLSTVNRIIRSNREGNISFVGRQGNRRSTDKRTNDTTKDVIHYGTHAYRTVGNYILEF